VAGRTVRYVLAVTLPIRGDIACVAHRKSVDIRSVTKNVNDLKGGSFLSLDAVRIDRVHQGDREILGQLAGNTQAIVEVAENLDDSTAMDNSLGEFASCNLALGYYR